jgi:outer membrane protein assembly factor BamB
MQTDVLVIGSNGYVACINTANGQEIWRTKLWDSLLGGSRGKDVSVLIDGAHVYAGCYGYVSALDIVTGKIIWENELKGLGHNEIALAKQGTSTQFITRLEYETTTSGG